MYRQGLSDEKFAPKFSWTLRNTAFGDQPDSSLDLLDSVGAIWDDFSIISTPLRDLESNSGQDKVYILTW